MDDEGREWVVDRADSCEITTRSLQAWRSIRRLEPRERRQEAGTHVPDQDRETEGARFC